MSETKRVLAIDYGSRFVGLAVGNSPGITAKALETLDTKKGDLLFNLKTIISREKIQHAILGFPFSDVEGDIHQKIRLFRDTLVKDFPTLEIEFVDESYSSQEADALILETGLGRRSKKRTQDSQAAKIILLRYLSR